MYGSLWTRRKGTQLRQFGGTKTKPWQGVSLLTFSNWFMIILNILNIIDDTDYSIVNAKLFMYHEEIYNWLSCITALDQNWFNIYRHLNAVLPKLIHTNLNIYIYIYVYLPYRFIILAALLCHRNKKLGKVFAMANKERWKADEDTVEW